MVNLGLNNNILCSGEVLITLYKSPKEALIAITELAFPNDPSPSLQRIDRELFNLELALFDAQKQVLNAIIMQKVLKPLYMLTPVELA